MSATLCPSLLMRPANASADLRVCVVCVWCVCVCVVRVCGVCVHVVCVCVCVLLCVCGVCMWEGYNKNNTSYMVGGAFASFRKTHMAEDHRLSNTDNPVEVRQSTKLLILISTLYIELLYVAKTLFCSLQTNNDRLWDHTLGELHHFITVGG